MYAVTIEPLGTIFFLAERPEGKGWEAIQQLATVHVQEGVGIDIAPNFDSRPEGAAPPEHVLCVSTTEPKNYKIFRYHREVNGSSFRPTGKDFGGVFSKRTWERFQEKIPAWLASLAIPDTDPPGAMEEALRNIRGAR
jgi:hypothetical protein